MRLSSPCTYTLIFRQIEFVHAICTAGGRGEPSLNLVEIKLARCAAGPASRGDEGPNSVPCPDCRKVPQGGVGIDVRRYLELRMRCLFIWKEEGNDSRRRDTQDLSTSIGHSFVEAVIEKPLLSPGQEEMRLFWALLRI